MNCVKQVYRRNDSFTGYGCYPTTVMYTEGGGPRPCMNRAGFWWLLVEGRSGALYEHPLACMGEANHPDEIHIRRFIAADKQVRNVAAIAERCGWINVEDIKEDV